MNEIIYSEQDSNRVVYFNGVPYYALARNKDYPLDWIPDFLIRLGDRGEDIRYAVHWRVWGEGGKTIAKIIDDKCYIGTNDKNFVLLQDNIIGGVYSYRTSRLSLIQSNGDITTYSVPEFKSSDVRKYNIYPSKSGNIKAVYPTRDSYAILQDDNNNLFIWRDKLRINESIKLPGKRINIVSSGEDFTQGDEYIRVHFALTDKGLFLFHDPEKKNIFEGVADLQQIESGHEHTRLYEIPLPENISPDDIKSFEFIKDSNMFLLTNKGKVYSIGKNTYYQRGTTKKLDPHKWNQIKYPEKIVSIAPARLKPGLFALSENGNLYYHGYSEGSYSYPITNRKSNIAKPLKIMEGVRSIWAPQTVVAASNRKGVLPLEVAPVFVSDKTGNIFMLPIKRQLGGSYKGVFTESSKRAYLLEMHRLISHDLVHTPVTIKTIIKLNC